MDVRVKIVLGFEMELEQFWKKFSGEFLVGFLCLDISCNVDVDLCLYFICDMMKYI